MTAVRYSDHGTGSPVRRIRWVFAALGLLLSGLVIAVACGGGDSGLRHVKGRTLEIYYESPIITQSLVYSRDGQDYLIEAEDPSKRIAVVNVTVVNWMSTVVHLSIDGNAAQLGDRRGERVGALDPFEAGQGAGVTDPEEGEYLPFLWGALELKRDYQVSGWMVFDVPERLRLASLWWNESEPMVKFDAPF